MQWRNISLAILFLLVLGCSERLSSRERLFCLDLASESYSFLPECETQEQCFLELQKKLFGFDESAFSFQAQQELLSFKNNVSASWLHYNRALKNIRAISSACGSGRTTSDILLHLNELNHNLLRSFGFADTSFKKAFGILVLEKSFLENQGIMLVKEEKLFDSFMLLNANLNDLTNSNDSGSTFASNYLKESKRFLSLSKSTGFSSVSVKETSLLELVEKYSPDFFKNLGGKRFYVPIISDAFSSFVSGISNLLRASKTISVLQHQPSFEFLQSYGGMMSAQNSVLSGFVGIIKQSSENRNELSKQNNEAAAVLDSKLSGIRKLVSELSDEFYSSNSKDFLSELAFSFNQNTRIVSQKFKINSVSGAKEKLLNELQAIEKSFTELKQRGFVGSISLGEKTSKLKQLLLEAAELEQNADFLNSELVRGTELLCEQRVKAIKESIGSASSASLQISQLKTRLSFRLNAFESAKGTREKIVKCKQAMDAFSEMDSALKNLQAFFEAKTKSLSSCMSFLEDFFSTGEYRQRHASDFLLRYQWIKQVAQPAEDAVQAVSFCEVLKEDILGELSASQEINNIHRLYKKARELFSSIESVHSNSPELLKEKGFSKLRERLDFFSGYFQGDRLLVEKAIRLIGGLEKEIIAFNGELEQQLETALIEYAKKNLSVEVISPETLKANAENHTVARIILSNPFSFPIQHSVSFSLPFSTKFSGMVFSTPNVSRVKTVGRELAVELSSLPKGLTVFDLNTIVFVKTEESTRVELATESRLVVSKKILVVADTAIPRLEVETILDALNESKVTDIAVFSGQKQLSFTRKQNRLLVFVENALPVRPIEVFYSILEPVQKEVFLEKSIELAADSQLQNYRIELRNNSPFKLENLAVTLPINQIDNAIEHIEIINEEGKKPRFLLQDNGNIVVFFDGLLPGQPSKAFLSLRIKGSARYWREAVERLLSKAFLLSSSETREVSEKALAIHESLLSLPRDFFRKQAELEGFHSLQRETEQLERKNSSFKKFSEEFSALRQLVENDLRFLESQLSELSQLGLETKQEELRARTAKAREVLDNAVSMFSLNGFEWALKELYKAKTILAVARDFSHAELFSKEISRIMNDTNAAIKSLHQHGIFSPDAELLQKEIFSLHSKTVSEIAAENFAEAKKSFLGIRSKNSRLKELTAESLKQKALKTLGLIETIEALVGREAKQKIAALWFMLGSVDEAELIKARYVLPITSARLKKSERELEGLFSKSLAKSIEKFRVHVQNNDFEQALSSINSSGENLEEGLSLALSINEDLNRAIGRIKEDAVVLHNTAVARFNESQTAPEAEHALKESEDFLQEAAYLESIVAASKVTGLAPAHNTPIPAVIYFVPVIAAIGLILAVRKYREKTEKKRELETQKVLKSWE